MRNLIVIALLALVVAGCGESGQPVAVQTTSRAVPSGDDGAAAVATSTTSADSLAPDFQLELGDGSTFNLRDEQKPVYLVFWAEW